MIGITAVQILSWVLARQYHEAIGHSEGMDRLQMSEWGIAFAWIFFTIGVLPKQIIQLDDFHPIRIILIVSGPIFKIIFQLIRARGWRLSSQEVDRMRRTGRIQPR